MKNAKKVLLLVLCAVLLVGASVMGTLAYLTSQDTVVNTFTVGKVEITLDEAKVDEYGVVDATATDRVDANKYKLIPGHTYVKDPIVHVDDESEKCWVYVQLSNGLKNVISGTSIEAQMAALGWNVLDEEKQVYVYYAPVDPSVEGADLDLEVFNSFTVNSAADETVLSGYQNASIVVTAYAVQADGFADANAAWTATYGAPANP